MANEASEFIGLHELVTDCHPPVELEELVHPEEGLAVVGLCREAYAGAGAEDGLQ